MAWPGRGPGASVVPVVPLDRDEPVGWFQRSAPGPRLPRQVSVERWNRRGLVFPPRQSEKKSAQSGLFGDRFALGGSDISASNVTSARQPIHDIRRRADAA